MQWSEMFTADNEPSSSEIAEFVDTPLWGDLADHLCQSYNVRPKLSYSGCSMDGGSWKGWNVKYKKSGRALCSLYPKQGYFVALIAVGNKELAEAELLIPLCEEYTQALWNRTNFGHYGKSLAVEVTNENVLRDVKNLITLRVGAKITKGQSPSWS